MKLTLRRLDFIEDGIFGHIEDEKGEILFTSLEHAYLKVVGEWISDTIHTSKMSREPKLPPGEYTCKRGKHKLHDLIEFETFEVMNVPGHTGILFHAGNYNDDSTGCILVGDRVTDGVNKEGKKCKMITASKMSFGKFMNLVYGLDEFTLTVVNN